METTLPKDQTLQIPVARIRPNSANPRKGYRQEEVQSMADSLRSGQVTEIKVRPLTPEERADDPDHDYEVIGGDLRLAAAKILGWETLAVQVLDVTPQAARRIAILDNVRKDMNWLAWYETAETLMADNPDLTQDQAAKLIAKDPSHVAKGLKLLKLLSFSARQAILANCQKPGGFDLPEATALQLRDLATGNGGDQAKVEATLNVLLERRMNADMAVKLVAWVRQGNSPESFPDDGKLSKQKGLDPTDPNAQLWQELPRGLQIHKTPKGYKLAWNLSEADAPVAVYGALTCLEEMREQGGMGQADARFSSALPGLIEKGINAKAKSEQPGKKDIISTEVASSSTPAYSAGTPRNDRNKGLLGRIGDVLQQKTGLTPEILKQGAEAMLAKDAKQAANYEIRRKMRNLLKGWF